MLHFVNCIKWQLGKVGLLFLSQSSNECSNAKTVVPLCHEDQSFLNIISLNTDIMDATIPIHASIQTVHVPAKPGRHF